MCRSVARSNGAAGRFFTEGRKGSEGRPAGDRFPADYTDARGSRRFSSVSFSPCAVEVDLGGEGATAPWPPGSGDATPPSRGSAAFATFRRNPNSIPLATLRLGCEHSRRVLPDLQPCLCFLRGLLGDSESCSLANGPRRAGRAGPKPRAIGLHLIAADRREAQDVRRSQQSKLNPRGSPYGQEKQRRQDDCRETSRRQVARRSRSRQKTSGRAQNHEHVRSRGRDAMPG
jgi:hypothetical protein